MGRGGVRDRDVLILALSLAAAVLALMAVSAAFPAVDDVMGGVPVVALGLAVATVLVLARALTRSRPRR